MAEKWEAKFDELDTECLAAQTIAMGSSWAALAVACALVDAGVIDKGRLLKIIDALHSIASAESADRLGETDDALLVLETLRGALEGWDLRPGAVLQELQRQEHEGARALRHLSALWRRKRE